MPAGDRTGPWGLGPETGRSLGYCSGYPTPGYKSPGPGLGMGRGFSMGRGFGRGRGIGRGRWFGRPYGAYGACGAGLYPGDAPFAGPAVPPPTREQEQAALEGRAKVLQDQLEHIEARLRDLKEAAGA